MGCATDMRREAVARLVEIVGDYRSPFAAGGWEGDWSRIDIGVILARKDSIRLLRRDALSVARGDELLRGEVEELVPIAQGNATALLDAVTYARGLPERAPTERMTLDDLDRVIAEELS